MPATHPDAHADKFTWTDFTVVKPKKHLSYREGLQAILLEFNPDQPRDEAGRWAGGAANRMAVLKVKYPVVAENYGKHSGTEMGSIEAHTADVAREWEKQLTPEQFGGISQRFGSDVQRLMESAIPLHDIGKPAALAKGDKHLQHAHTVPILQDVLRKEGFHEKDIALATELLNHDKLGALLQRHSRDTAEVVAEKLDAKAQKVGMSTKDFATLQMAFYNADAAAYPYVQQFMRQEPSGRWTFEHATQLAPIVALTKPSTRHLSTYAVPAFDLGGEGSGNFGHAGRHGEVGGSAKTEGTQGLKFRELTEQERSAFNTRAAAKVGEKKDGGKVVVNSEVKGLAFPVTVTRQLFGKRDPADVVGQMVEDLPGDLRASWQAVSADTDKEISKGATALRLYVRGERTSFTRTFIREPDGTLTVHHDVFEIPKDQQGKGVAKAVLADSYQTYRELGVDKIETLANLDRGGYAWAKFGFKAERPNTLATVLTENLTGRPATDRRLAKGSTVPDLTPTQRSNMLAVIAAHKDDPKLPWHVANMVTADGRQVGKELLYDSSWFAKLDMHDRESTAKLEAYVKGH